MGRGDAVCRQCVELTAKVADLEKQLQSYKDLCANMVENIGYTLDDNDGFKSDDEIAMEERAAMDAIDDGDFDTPDSDD